MADSRRGDLIWLVALLPLLAARHLQLTFSRTEFAHFDLLVEGLRELDRGVLWVRGPEAWDSGISHSGLLYYLLHLPARVFSDPIFGIHFYYATLEFGGLAIWLLLGRRAGLDAPLRRVSAALLAVACGSKLVVCENMSLAVLLSVPLFVTAAAALRCAKPWVAALAGVLLGLAATVHLAAAVLVLPLLVVWWWIGRSRATILWATLGAVVAFAPFLAGGSGSEGASVGATLVRLWRDFSLTSWAGGVALYLPLPLGLIGAWLVWRRRNESDATARLALCWLVLPYLPLSLAISYLGTGQHESRHALLQPGRAVLAAMALLWIADRLRLRLAHHVPALRRAAAHQLLAPLWFALMLWFGGTAAMHYLDFTNEFSKEQQTTCSCAAWMRQTDARFVARTAARLRPCLMRLVDRGEVEVVGPHKDMLGSYLYWYQHSGRRLLAPIPGADGRLTRLLVMPRLPGVDPALFAGSQTCGDLVFVPDVVPGDVRRPDDHRSSAVLLDPQSRGPRRLVATFCGEYGFSADARLSLTHDGVTLQPQTRCTCHFDFPLVVNHAQWALFRLPAARTPPDPNHRMEVQHSRGRVFQMELVETK